MKSPMNSELILKQIKRELKRLDPHLEVASEGWNAALVLLASLAIGPHVRRIAKLTRLPRKCVMDIGRRLRANGVWVGSKLQVDWPTNIMSFWLDVNVALGYLERTDAR
jgi:hypothetical protein